MANPMLFSSRGNRLPTTDAVNEAGGNVYALSPRQALAQYAATGCLNGTYYAGAQTRLGTVLRLCERVNPEFIARTAVWCRRHGGMKDTPAPLCAVLSVRGKQWLPAASTIDGGVAQSGRARVLPFLVAHLFRRTAQAVWPYRNSRVRTADPALFVCFERVGSSYIFGY